jgi:RHS repeat-associated protein
VEVPAPEESESEWYPAPEESEEEEGPVPPPEADEINITTNYCGNIIYEGNDLKYILNPEGYAYKKNGNIYYTYYTRDHLGNNWKAGDQINNYYPSGMENQFISQNPEKQPYKFGGKELDEMHGLNWYDFGARPYDPLREQFITMDPLAEKYYSISPYAYCANNPMRYVDPTGMWIEISYNGSNYRYDNGQLYQYQTEGEKIGQWTSYTAESGSFLSGINNALNTISKTASGDELIGFFANDDNNAYIQATSEANSIDLDGSVNIIHLNENLNGSLIPTEYGDQTSPFWLDAAHELAHRQDFISNGESTKTPWLTKPDGKTIALTEQYATQVENQIRADSRMPLRTHYVGLTSGGGWENSRILNTTRNSSGFGVNYLNGRVYVPRIKVPPLPASKH